MKEIIISPGESGQRFDKFLGKYLRNAGRSFLYKMLRKKNITLNGKKAEGSELLAAGDSVKLFFSDETLEKFIGEAEKAPTLKPLKLDIIYEDEDIILINKPAGLLSQKAEAGDLSLCEYINAYIEAKPDYNAEASRAFKASVCNRLDRNTSGLISAGKSLKGLQSLSKAFKDRNADKYYLAIVKGEIHENISFSGYLLKDEKTNKVELFNQEVPRSEKIETEIYPVSCNKGYSQVKVKLLTGKTHQIRATLFKLGYPIVGDKKYGAMDLSLARRQMLHSYELCFISEGKTYRAQPPADFMKVLNGLDLNL